jgi:hypothetical protein
MRDLTCVVDSGPRELEALGNYTTRDARHVTVYLCGFVASDVAISDYPCDFEW